MYIIFFVYIIIKSLDFFYTRSVTKYYYINTLLLLLFYIINKYGAFYRHERRRLFYNTLFLLICAACSVQAVHLHLVLRLEPYSVHTWQKNPIAVVRASDRPPGHAFYTSSCFENNLHVAHYPTKQHRLHCLPLHPSPYGCKRP